MTFAEVGQISGVAPAQYAVRRQPGRSRAQAGMRLRSRVRWSDPNSRSACSFHPD